MCTRDDFRATESLLQKHGDFFKTPEQETNTFYKLVALEFMETNNRPANIYVLGSCGQLSGLTANEIKHLRDCDS